MRRHPGEPEATGWRPITVLDTVQRLHDASPDVAGRPRLIAIDGRGGAGKTTVAERLRRAVPNSAVVHTDDVAWHHACFDWGALLAEHVLAPLHRGEAVDYRPDAWAAHDRPGAITVPAGLDYVWIEGTGIIRAELARWLDASMWLQGARDGNAPEQREHVAAWLREELPFMLRERPWSRATMIVAGPPPPGHDPETGLLVAPPIEHS
ncbi:hypothetical protein [Dactylosporangium sp. NPDC051541]|uniref:hypothetical protein n=1 Tax=Dactylosporangium sp. NPDC051541 TaxID=3363977 RepID=UPI00379738CE